MVNPGVTPSLLRLVMVQVPAAGGRPAFVPLSSVGMCSGSLIRGPTRLVNQLESGTSSTVLTLTARTALSSPAPRNEFSMRSYWSLTSTGFACEASWLSGSFQIGSSE